MAKITILTDQGEIINLWSDAADQIGDLTQKIAAADFLIDLRDCLAFARLRDHRTIAGRPIPGDPDAPIDHT